MIFLGQFKAGEIVPYAETFHNDQGNAEDPTSPSATIRNADGTWSALATPTKLNNTTGLFGGTIDTTGLQPGLYLVSLRGTVSTSKTVGTVLAFRIIANTEADVMGRLGTPAGTSIAADVAAVKSDTGAIKTKTDALPANPANETTVQAIKAKTDNLPIDPASNTQVNTRLAAADYIAPDNASIVAIKTKTDSLPIDPLTSIVPGNYASGTAGYILGTLTSGQITVVSPVSKDGGTITLYRGDDYFAADGRALEWTDTGALWPDLTGATVNFKAGTLTKACVVVTATGVNKKVRVELSKTDINALPDPYYAFEIEATLANGHVITLATGKLYIK